MKTRLFSFLYLLALAFGANVLADEAEYNQADKQEEEQAEGEVEEAKTGLNFHETDVDNFFIDIRH